MTSLAAFQSRHPGLVWSNSRAGEEVWLRSALLHPRFHTVLDACLEFGLDRVRHEWAVLAAEGGREVERVAPEVARMLQHIAEGFADAQA